MPRDPRPFVTYPLNYTGHPRIEALSAAAFRVFHEMNDHSRVHGLDGVIPTVVARKRWPRKALAELVAGIDDRPLVVLSEEGYFLRSYAEHQYTTTDIDALRSKRAAAGRAGGKAKATAQQEAGKGLASASPDGWQNLAESESELTDLTDITPDPESSPDSYARATGLDNHLEDLIAEKTEQATHRAELLGIRQPNLVWARLEEVTETRMTFGTAIDLAAIILNKAPRQVQKPDAYIARACERPDEVQELLANLDVEVLA